MRLLKNPPATSPRSLLVPIEVFQQLDVLEQEPTQYWRSRAELPWN
jgi:hypothetical protein